MFPPDQNFDWLTGYDVANMENENGTDTLTCEKHKNKIKSEKMPDEWKNLQNHSLSRSQRFNHDFFPPGFWYSVYRIVPCFHDGFVAKYW